jgi:hypothetical protein
MTAVALAPAAPRAERSAPATTRRRRLPVENLVMYTLATAFYIAAASYLVFHMHFMIGDAYARIDNAFDVLFTSDPHLAAIGLFWPPLPSFLELPIIAFKPLWPDLVTKGFAGSIEAALFSAGTVVLINSGLRWAGVMRGLRWLICLVWVANPMTIIYAAQGMSEAPFVFFFVASILVYLRWSESRRTALLPLLGVLAGLGCLCRNEAFVIAFVLGIGVAVQCVRDRGSWRQVETEWLLYALPAVLVAMLWIGSQAVIVHDPLYWLHANTGSSAMAATPGRPVALPSASTRASAYGLVHFNAVPDAANFIIGRSIALFPGVLVLLAALAARLALQPKRVSGFFLLALGVAIPLLDIELIRQGLAPDIRYQIAVIPFTFLMALYVLRSLRGRRLSTLAAVAMTVALLVSTGLGIQTLADPMLAPQEAPVLAAFQNGQRIPAAVGESPMDDGADLAVNILALNRDNGRMLCDSTTCFPIVLNVPDATRFIVTSDLVFEAAVAQPQVYHVEYFLVPAPVGLGAFDRLNILYPDLYASGSGFARLAGSYNGWKLYRITGPTGHGG